jgi:integrase
MKMRESQPNWVQIKPYLVRYVPSGKIYARFRAAGKLIQKSLKTDRVSVAELRLRDLMKQERGKAEGLKAEARGKMTFRDAQQVFLNRLEEDYTLKPRSKDYYRERMNALLKSWPGLKELDITKITKSDCLHWAAKYRKESSASAFNNTVSTLRQIINIACEAGARYENPALAISRSAVKPKTLKLPEAGKFLEFVSVIENSRVNSCYLAADFVRFLAFGGFRKNEAAHITWADCDFERGEILVRITKNGDPRRVPMIPEMRVLLMGLQAERKGESPETTVMRVRECQRSMDKACKAVGIPRITHHDLRHLFATCCIESGVDIPTVSRWLGHRDGGALAMRVYGHLRDHHSAAMAQRVSFTKEVPENIVELQPVKEAHER